MKKSSVWLGIFSYINDGPKPSEARGSLVKSGFCTMELSDNSEHEVRVSGISSWLQMLLWASILHSGLTSNRLLSLLFINFTRESVVQAKIGAKLTKCELTLNHEEKKSLQVLGTVIQS
jgi:hypothetical protein